ncbi:acetyl-CoA acetyltransferase [Thermopolyspora flexuosa]|uniref:Acetyl-CoA C-acetyltransferase n=1 Tax=Thermopolyspora flexuosa TaxID=103836 RepID=A0A543IPF2_9ACTN|nr:acetyl-CoA acetyltransferase [Thermopolyspora flexuosa]TQM72455.1 acetyl-CoA C-acetyltransferase [Thermopolyspora flexuosa]GGM70538.1 acetyl-CoA acetyltransferase [Thermopolyspora flexuosa]
MTTGVWILGGHQTDFARNWTREGLELSDLAREVTTKTLEDAGLEPADVDVIHVGNAFGELYTGQGHLGGMPATVLPELWGTPAARHEAACASGGVAILAAMADLESGRYDVALVLGLELERTVPGDLAAERMRAASWVGHEAQEARFVWPYTFAALADEYDRRYGVDDRHLRAIAELNFRNAKANPNAQTRSWEFTDRHFTDDDEVNPPVAGRLRRYDCSQITDGGAGLVLVSERFLAERAPSGVRSRVQGWGHRTVALPLDHKLRRSADEPYVLPHVREAALDAFRRAGIPGVAAVDGVEVHDCFTMSEYLAIDHLGLTGPGESWKAIENGDLERDGRCPVNPGGGLLGIGHPVGATGVRMVLDAHRQVTGTAGPTQLERARRFATLNIGGSTTTTVSFVIGTE